MKNFFAGSENPNSPRTLAFDPHDAEFGQFLKEKTVRWTSCMKRPASQPVLGYATTSTLGSMGFRTNSGFRSAAELLALDARSRRQ